jgi:hypothetical protein
LWLVDGNRHNLSHRLIIHVCSIGGGVVQQQRRRRVLPLSLTYKPHCAQPHASPVAIKRYSYSYCRWLGCHCSTKRLYCHDFGWLPILPFHLD